MTTVAPDAPAGRPRPREPATSTSPPIPTAPTRSGPNPTRAEVQAAVERHAASRSGPTSPISPLDMGIIGREVLRFDGSDPRFTGELLHGPLDPGGDAFGGDHWADEYAAIRGGNLILAVLPTASALTAEEQSATIRVCQDDPGAQLPDGRSTRHTQDSIPIVTDTSRDRDAGAVLDQRGRPSTTSSACSERAKAELTAGGAAFPFILPPGFPASTRPRRSSHSTARCGPGSRSTGATSRERSTALTESFIDPAAPLDLGVYMDYGTGPGDFANPLALDPQQGENFAHPSLETGAQLQVDGVTLDQRFLDKIVPRTVTSADGLTSDLGWIRYPTPEHADPDHQERGADPAPGRGIIGARGPRGGAAGHQHRAHAVGPAAGAHGLRESGSRRSTSCCTTRLYSLHVRGRAPLDRRSALRPTGHAADRPSEPGLAA